MGDTGIRWLHRRIAALSCFIHFLEIVHNLHRFNGARVLIARFFGKNRKGTVQSCASCFEITGEVQRFRESHRSDRNWNTLGTECSYEVFDCRRKMGVGLLDALVKF